MGSIAKILVAEEPVIKWVVTKIQGLLITANLDLESLTMVSKEEAD